MKAILNGGPAHTREVEVFPGGTTYLVPIPRPIDLLTVHDQPSSSDIPYHDVAEYRFSGLGIVDTSGLCSARIFNYHGTYRA